MSVYFLFFLCFVIIVIVSIILAVWWMNRNGGFYKVFLGGKYTQEAQSASPLSAMEEPSETKSSQKPNMLRMLYIINGFLGWFLVFGIYWGIIFNLTKYFPGPSAMVLTPFFCFPLPINIITLIVLMIKPRWRWIAVGIISALAINLIGGIFFSNIIFYKGISLLDSIGESITSTLISIPFFLGFFDFR